jgi:hypothetical protein
MRIAILGSGLMGGKIGTLFARAGHAVVFSYARSAAKLQRLAQAAGNTASAGTPREAVRDAEVVLLAVHWARIDDVLRQAGDLSGKLVLTCSLPLNLQNTELVLGHTTSGAEALAEKLPGTEVIAAFQTIPSEILFGTFDRRGKAKPPSLVYCGGTPTGKSRAAGLIRDLGFQPVDAGPLRMARSTEPFALLVAQLAYGNHESGGDGPELAYRFEWLVA